MKFIIFVLTLCFVILASTGKRKHNNHKNVGFYWDNFSLSVTAKGVKGGRDMRNRDMYIGLVKHAEGNKELLIPGVIYPYEGKIIYEWNQMQYVVNNNFKILCTEYPDQMEWIQTNTHDVKNLMHEKELIPAGYSQEHNKYYVGRTQTDDGLAIGKVIISNGKKTGFHTVTKSGYIHRTEFEILIHQIK